MLARRARRLAASGAAPKAGADVGAGASATGSPGTPSKLTRLHARLARKRNRGVVSVLHTTAPEEPVAPVEPPATSEAAEGAEAAPVAAPVAAPEDTPGHAALTRARRGGGSIGRVEPRVVAGNDGAAPAHNPPPPPPPPRVGSARGIHVDRVPSPSSADGTGSGGDSVSGEDGSDSDDEEELTEAQAALLRATLAKMGPGVTSGPLPGLSGAQHSLLERTLHAAQSMEQPMPPMPPTPPPAGQHYDSADSFARALALKVAQEWERKRELGLRA